MTDWLRTSIDLRSSSKSIVVVVRSLFWDELEIVALITRGQEHIRLSQTIFAVCENEIGRSSPSVLFTIVITLWLSQKMFLCPVQCQFWARTTKPRYPAFPGSPLTRDSLNHNNEIQFFYHALQGQKQWHRVWCEEEYSSIPAFIWLNLFVEAF